MLKTRQELQDLRERCRRRREQEEVKILVCSGTGCVATGAFDVHDALLKALNNKGIVCSVKFMEDEPGVGLKQCGCLGLCELGVMVRIEPEGYVYTKVTPADCDEIVEETIKNGRYVERLAYNRGGVVARKQEEIPFYHKQKRLVLEKCGRIDATSILEYIAADGYTALEKSLFEMEPGAVVAEVAERAMPVALETVV